MSAIGSEIFTADVRQSSGKSNLIRKVRNELDMVRFMDWENETTIGAMMLYIRQKITENT